jgi:tripartite-type tricarboxylate transporter receptor subunit TctC
MKIIDMRLRPPLKSWVKTAQFTEGTAYYPTRHGFPRPKSVKTQAMQDLLDVLPLVKSGKLKALGVTSAKRSSAAPGLPTIAEGGVRGYDFSSWFGFFAPAGTPREIIAKLNREIVHILETPEIKQRLTRDGADVIAGTPQEFAAYLVAETKKWPQVIKQAGIRAD